MDRRSSPHLQVSPGLRAYSLHGRFGGNGLRFVFCFGYGVEVPSGGAVRATALSLDHCSRTNGEQGFVLPTGAAN